MGEQEPEVLELCERRLYDKKNLWLWIICRTRTWSCGLLESKNLGLWGSSRTLGCVIVERARTCVCGSLGEQEPGVADSC